MLGSMHHDGAREYVHVACQVNAIATVGVRVLLHPNLGTMPGSCIDPYVGTERMFCELLLMLFLEPVQHFRGGKILAST